MVICFYATIFTYLSRWEELEVGNSIPMTALVVAVELPHYYRKVGFLPDFFIFIESLQLSNFPSGLF